MGGGVSWSRMMKWLVGWSGMKAALEVAAAHAVDVRIPGDSSGRVLFAPGMPGSPLSERLPEDAGVEEMEEKKGGGEGGAG